MALGKNVKQSKEAWGHHFERGARDCVGGKGRHLGNIKKRNEEQAGANIPQAITEDKRVDRNEKR